MLDLLLAWVPDEHDRNFLGNEFLLWLWFQLDGDEDVVKLSDGTEVAVMLARTLLLYTGLCALNGLAFYCVLRSLSVLFTCLSPRT